ncbi:Smr/MutS family protein [Candidatus Thioglobus sp. NP1]|jgi:DNA-nicking Smr family endonuclease|uniref:Smr/MutS family protein n=1 Tax=Candidatus Thioglobus sp. NP1 TaxID=2508687 RepID=UPI000DED87AF|nr:Smr/MutS family protein [Candidatus Thioglobus sp. NP1]AXE62495.1 hypothetical protein CRN91_07520 [Candidatus Thioglobus sp. NP1]|tara:strand:+ start:4461 stop:4958 length:498 start_codon:yes stop_codon:yes gene_type:complete
MVNESDKLLFRETIDKQITIDKDNNKNNAFSISKPDKPFEGYSYLYEPNILGSEPVIHAKAGLSAKIVKKMKQGNIGSTPSIDLHGHKIEEACQALSRFIHFHSDERFIHIIHGKGYHSDNGLSIIKSQVVNYLKQHPQVLGFCSCPQAMGGTGAVFACLKKANV